MFSLVKSNEEEIKKNIPVAQGTSLTSLGLVLIVPPSPRRPVIVASPPVVVVVGPGLSLWRRAVAAAAPVVVNS